MNEQQAEQPWVALYRSALLEVDYRNLAQRVAQAGKAMQERLGVITGEPGHLEEQRALGDALQNLRVVEREIEDWNRNPAPEQTPSAHSHPELSGEYVVFVDSARRYVEVSEGVCRLLGYTRNEILAMTIDDITPPELRLEVSGKFQQYVARGGLEGEYLLMAKDGRRVPIRYRSRVFPDGCLVAKWTPLPAA